MKSATTHIIRRQVFELSTSNSKEGFECQQRMSHYIHQMINPQLEACFEKLQLGSQHLVIDKLEIDLGTFSKDEFEKQLISRFMEMLDKQLRNYINTVRESRKLIAGMEIVTASPDATVQLINDTKAFYTALHYFLQYGRLPWWYETAQQTTSPDALFNIELIEILEEEEKQSLKEVLRQSQAARMRLANHFSTAWIVQFLEHTGIAGVKAAEQWQLLLSAVKEFASLEKVFHQYFWMAWIEAATSQVQTINITLLIEKAARGYNDTAIVLAKAIHSISVVHSINNSIIWAGYKEQIEKYLSHKMPYDEFRKQLSIQAPGAAMPNAFTTTSDDPANKPNSDLIKESTKQPQKTKSAEEEDDEAIFVTAAGLVIIHPFLAELFTSSGLWEGQQWRDDNSVYRALQMLSQLAYGETGLPEYQLSFLKILLGIDIETPLPAQEPLTNDEQETCTNLLQAVISHWTALRNSSPASIQEGFLQRQGKLVQNKKGYHLTVERLAQDVLLSRLPWGYSMIKLPWMNSMLHVTWL